MSQQETIHPSTTEVQTLFYALLQLGIGTKDKLTVTHPISDETWKEIIRMARKQAVSGILMDGILKLPAEFMPPTPIKLKEIQYLLRMEQLNLQLNRGTVEVSKYLKQDGFDCTILKGQGIACYYPNPLHRTPGDIDVWPDGTPQEIKKYSFEKFSAKNASNHHIDLPILKPIEVELHFEPSYMYNPITHKRFSQFCKKHRKSCATNMVLLEENTQKVAVATDAFNRVYILQHIMRHLFYEGIGLRQLMDYCLVLRKGMTKEEKSMTIKELDRLSMKGFAQAVMYVLQSVFALEEQYLILPPDIKKGKMLLEEIMESGNFGQHDQRYDKQKMNNIAYKLINRFKRNARIVQLAPSEAFFSIGFMICNYLYVRTNRIYLSFRKK